MCDTGDMRATSPMFGAWVRGARPRTLPAAIVPVAVGTAAASGIGVDRWWAAGAALAVSLALQVGVNFANDYSDGIRGVDTDRVGPTRLVGSGLVAPRAVRNAAFVSFGVAAISGLLVAAAVSWWLLLVGVVSVAAGWLYTGGPRPYGYMGLGEVFVFVFFGLVATLGTQFVVADRITLEGVVAAVVVGLLAVALLVINNLRDIPGDSVSGKATLAVRLGDKQTRVLYAAVVVAAFIGIVLLGVLAPPTLVGLLAVPLAIAPLRCVRHGDTGANLIPVLGATARVQLVAGLLLAGGLALAAV